MGRRKWKFLLCLPFVFVILIFSWLLSLMLEHFSGHLHILSVKKRPDQDAKKQLLERTAAPLFVSGRDENIFTFIQISDIHISKFRYVDEIIPQLEEFCRVYVPIIKPKVVIVTGDLTDAKTRNNKKSQQFLEEWISYNKLIEHCKIQFNTLWLDIRGNHDDFGLSNHDSKLNLYRQYGASHNLYGESGTYQYILEMPFGRYAFNAIDLAPNPGPDRPFNFFGIVEERDMRKMKKMARESFKYNMSIWFGHYPLSTINMPSKVRQVIQTGTVYLCGHLHTLGGLVSRMYARPTEGHLELEAGDWKENRRYRIAAVDHDIFSFVDVQYGSLPIILITNPKDARFMAAGREALERIKNSTHIRFLIFSRLGIRKASVFINDNLVCENSQRMNDQLFVCPWDPTRFMSGLHRITVNVQDEESSITRTTMPFSLDGSMPLLDIIPAIIMLSDFFLVAKMIYFAVFFTVVIIPLLIRYMNLQSSYVLVIPQQFILFLKEDHLFWPVFYYSIFLFIGPHFVGELVPGSIGVCFVHGIFTNGHWNPGSLTYIYGAVQITTFNIPLMFFLGDVSLHRRNSPKAVPTFTWKVRSYVRTLLCYLVFGMELMCQAYFAQSIFLCYGWMAFIICPVATWTIPFSVWMLHRCISFNA